MPAAGKRDLKKYRNNSTRIVNLNLYFIHIMKIPFYFTHSILLPIRLAMIVHMKLFAI